MGAATFWPLSVGLSAKAVLGPETTLVVVVEGRPAASPTSLFTGPFFGETRATDCLRVVEPGGSIEDTAGTALFADIDSITSSGSSVEPISKSSRSSHSVKSSESLSSRAARSDDWPAFGKTLFRLGPDIICNDRATVELRLLDAEKESGCGVADRDARDRRTSSMGVPSGLRIFLLVSSGRISVGRISLGQAWFFVVDAGTSSAATTTVIFRQ